MTTILLQIDTIERMLSTESVTVIGLLLGVCGLLIWHIVLINKKHDKEKAELKQDLKDFQDKLDSEFKESTTEIKSIIEKYYTLATKVLEKLNTVL